MKLKGKTCYACEAPATGREHFPPQAFVPDGLVGEACQTVPACRTHNEDRNLDDEYVGMLIRLVSDAAYEDPEQFAALKAAIDGKARRVFDRIDSRARPVGEITAIEVEQARVDRVFGDICRAAHFKVTTAKLSAPLAVSSMRHGFDHTEFGWHPKARHDPRLEPIVDALRQTEAFPTCGGRPECFTYQLTELGCVRLTFYRTLEVVGLFEGFNPMLVLAKSAEWLRANDVKPWLADRYERAVRTMLAGMTQR